MARLLFAFLIVTAAFAQAAFLPALHLLGVLPNVVLVLLLVWSALRGVGEGLIWVFATGLLLDLLAMDPLGTNALALLGVALLGGPARRRFFQSGLVFPMVLVIVATVAHAVVLLLLRSVGDAALPVGPAMRLIVLQAMLNALLVPPVYVVSSWVDRWVLEARG